MNINLDDFHIIGFEDAIWIFEISKDILLRKMNIDITKGTDDEIKRQIAAATMSDPDLFKNFSVGPDGVYYEVDAEIEPASEKSGWWD